MFSQGAVGLDGPKGDQVRVVTAVLHLFDTLLHLGKVDNPWLLQGPAGAEGTSGERGDFVSGQIKEDNNRTTTETS